MLVTKVFMTNSVIVKSILFRLVLYCVEIVYVYERDTVVFVHEPNISG